MVYLVCIGKRDIYGNQAVPSATDGVIHIYKGFRFRDPISVDVGRTQDILPEMIIISGTMTDSNGLLWRVHDGTRPLEDPAFVRHPHGKNIDSRPDRWSWGSQTKPKNNPPTSKNEGYLMDSTIKAF